MPNGRARRIVRQYDQVDCGPAALLGVLRHHGGDTNLVRVRELAQTDARGTTLLHLMQAAQALGFQARGATGEYDDLARETMPCIAHVVLDGRLQHYVVVYRITPKKVTLGDPGRGLVTLSREEFCAIWVQKAVLLLKPTEGLVRETPPHWLRWIGAHFRREETWLFQSVFLGAVYTLLGLLTALFVQGLIDRFIPEKSYDKILYTGLFLLALQLLRAGAGFLRQRFMIELGRRVNVRVNEEFLAHLFRLPSRFFDTRKTGDITARIHDAIKLQNAILLVFGQSIIDVLVVVGSLGFLLYLAPQLAWVALASIPAYAAIVALAARRVRAQQHEAMKGFAQVEASYIDHLRGIETIRGFNGTGVFARLNTLLFRGFQDSAKQLGHTQARVSLLAELAGGSVVLAALMLGAVLVIEDTLRLGEMMAAYSLLANTLPAVNRLIDANLSLQGAQVAASRLMDLLLVAPEANPGAQPFAMERAVTVQGARFGWPRGQLILRGVDLELPKGRLTGLWGLSGAGKSTLVSILQRNYPLAAGEVRVDDTPAEAVELADYRRQVVSVPETVTIFNGTIADNLLVGRAVADLSELQQRIERTGLAAVLRRFEAGLFTPVGEEGRQLSSGERQLVGLMRALLDEPAVLIVDEGINAIDVHTASLVLDTLARYAREHAVLLITHNLRTLLLADFVYLLENGVVSESGAPEQLLAGRGRFHEIWTLQDHPLTVAA